MRKTRAEESATSSPRIVSQVEWLEARKALVVKEKEQGTCMAKAAWWRGAGAITSRPAVAAFMRPAIRRRRRRGNPGLAVSHQRDKRSTQGAECGGDDRNVDALGGAGTVRPRPCEPGGRTDSCHAVLDSGRRAGGRRPVELRRDPCDRGRGRAERRPRVVWPGPLAGRSNVGGSPSPRETARVDRLGRGPFPGPS